MGGAAAIHEVIGVDPDGWVAALEHFGAGDYSISLATRYQVTAVEVVGPLYPDGTIGGKSYDPGPRTWLSVDSLRAKFTTFRWSRAPEWSGRWVAVVPD